MMKKFRRFITSPLATLLGFVLAIGLLLTGTIGGARAADLIESDFYTAGLELYDIGVTLNENGFAVGSRDYVPYSDYVWDEDFQPLLTKMLEESDGVLQLGRAYTEELSVTNSGTIDEYVRVTVNSYWQDAKGNKIPSLDPSTIDLQWENMVHSSEGNGAPWVMDDAATTSERNVLYYRTILTGTVSDLTEVIKDSVPFTSKITINADLPYTVSQHQEGNVIITDYIYDDMTFQLEVTVDAVQTHNARDAMKSAWGLTDADIARLGIAISE